MKKNIILTIAVAFMSVCSFAQSKPAAKTAITPAIEKQAKEATEKLKEQVSLTSDQYKKVMDINKDFYGQIEGMKGDGKPLAEDVKIKIRAMAQVRQDQINSLLTADQLDKLKKLSEGAK
jgi:hypothetical protein